MNIKKNLIFLEKQYGFSFSFQTFKTDISGNFYGPMNAYSYYNAHGCFTVYHAVQRGEWYYYSSEAYSDNQETLLSNDISELVFAAIKTKSKSLKYFFKSEIAIVAEIIMNQISEKSEFFEIMV